MDKIEKQKLLEDFAEFCHTQYLGCELDQNDKETWMYEYRKEVVNMIEDYLNK